MVNKKRMFKRLLFIGIPLTLVLLIGAAVITYFWQIRLQKPEEINMAHLHEQNTSDTALANAVHDHSTYTNSVSCDSITAEEKPGPVRRVHLTATRSTLQLDNGKSAEAWTFNGSSPGPELRVTEGDRLVVTLDNRDIEDGVTIHWHGIKVPCSQDGIAGVTQDAVMPGEQFTYTFIADTPGTYWYHSHQMSSIQAAKGLLGSLIIEPKPLPANADTESFHSSERADVSKEASALYQRLGDTALLNGSTAGLAVPASPGERVRLRLTNATNETIEFAVDGAPFRVLAMDGHDLNDPGLLEGDIVPVGAGQRYDLLIQVPRTGKVVVRSNSIKHLSIAIGNGDEPARSEGGGRFSFIDYGSPLAGDASLAVEADQRFTLELGQKLFVKTINGRAFHEIPPMIVKEGERLLITVSNKGGGDHPFHLHGHIFRVMSKNGVPLQGSPVYLDTLLTHEGDTFELYLEADNPGLWMAHCHNLDHASMGMSMMLNYEGITTPYRVGTKSGNLPDL